MEGKREGEKERMSDREMARGEGAKGENRELRTENREPRTENRELRTENREPRTENREPRTENYFPLHLKAFLSIARCVASIPSR